MGWGLLWEVWLVLRGLQEQKQTQISQSFCAVLQTHHQLQWFSQSERGGAACGSVRLSSSWSQCQFMYFWKSNRLRTGGGKQLRRVLLATSFLLLVSVSISSPHLSVNESKTSWGKQRLWHQSKTKCTQHVFNFYSLELRRKSNS